MLKFVFALVLVCLVATAHAADEKPKQRRPLAPLAHDLGQGFNIFTGTRHRPVLKMKNDNKKTWFNPYLQRTESVPDSVQVWVAGEAYEGVEVQATVEAYAAFQAAESGAADWVPGSYWDSEEVGRARWLFAEGERVCALAYETIALYETVVGDKGDQELQDDLAKLLPPVTDDSSDDDSHDLSHYHKIIDQYGTHVVFGAQFGGKFEFLASYKAGAYFKAGAAGVAKAAVAKFHKYRSGAVAAASEGEAEFEAEADFAFSFAAKGGLYEGYSKSGDSSSSASAVASATGHAKWAASVKTSPVNIKTTDLKPIHEFFSHPQHKSHMKKAMKQRFEKISLDKEVKALTDKVNF